MLGMANFIKITPPKGYGNPVVVPDTQVARRQYEKLNEVLEMEKKPLYKIENATEREIADFNPSFRKDEKDFKVFETLRSEETPKPEVKKK
jgi:hypothetical protein